MFYTVNCLFPPPPYVRFLLRHEMAAIANEGIRLPTVAPQRSLSGRRQTDAEKGLILYSMRSKHGYMWGRQYMETCVILRGFRSRDCLV